ncbi:MAG TPA: M23 family metallopeptidase [Mycobacteriales bacterium]|nr:M23 family metallopeptidase [Mycobacteriales bacterium]
MLHARRRLARGRLAAPALLVAVHLAAFGGLAVIAPATADTEPRPVAAVEAGTVPLLADVELLREREIARASRDRHEAQQRAAQAKAAAEAKAKADAEAAAKAKAAAEAAARAKAEAAAKAKAARAREAGIPASGGYACPVPNATFTDTYGAPRSGGRSHQGTDLMAPYGSPVYAVTSGVVRTASSSLGGISLYLHGDNGETYFYAHNSANVASSGQRVAAGDLVARVGSTGNAGGTNHVHFEREIGGRTVNPYQFLLRIC